MKKILRRLVITGGVLLLVLVILALAVPRFVSTDGVAEKIEREVARATGAEVTLDRAEFDWRGHLRLVLAEGRIQGTGAALASTAGITSELESYDVHIRELVVVPALLPLLRKQVEVKEISLAGESLTVVWQDGKAELAHYRVLLKDLNFDLEKAGMAGRPGGSPGAHIPADLAFVFAAAADTLILQGVPYSTLEAQGLFADKGAEVTEWKARRASGLLTGRLTADYSDDPWGHLKFEAEGKDLSADALLEPWLPELGRRLDCRLGLDLAGRCDLRDKATRLRTLDIAGTLTGSGGVLRAGDWLHEVAAYLGDRQDLKDVDFEALDHDFRFVQGRYLVEGLALTGGQTDWKGQGWVIPGGNLSLGLDVKLPPGFTPELGGFSFLAQSLRDGEGRINLPLTLSGPTDKPVVGVDLGRLMAP